MKPFRWGVFGTGVISSKFIAGLSHARGAEVVFVASRSLDKAKKFAIENGVERAIEGYAEAAATGGVDAIYIATPPSEHAAHALLSIEAGISVLVEKPFASTAADAARIAAAARAKGVFAMEAMWTRFLPAARAMKDELAARAIGDVRMITGSFGISQVPDPANGMFNAALGGGALAHLGAYPISLAQWLFGTPEVVQAAGNAGSTGVDEDAAFVLRYPGDVIGSFLVSIRCWAPDNFHALGSAGMIGFEGSIVRPFGLRIELESPRGIEAPPAGWKGRMRQHSAVHRLAQFMGRSSRSSGRRVDHHYAGNGYHYEADEVRNCIERGLVESSVMPLNDSVAVANTIDAIRERIL